MVREPGNGAGPWPDVPEQGGGGRVDDAECHERIGIGPRKEEVQVPALTRDIMAENGPAHIVWGGL